MMLRTSLVIGAMLSLCGAAHGQSQVLYDSLWIVDEGYMDAGTGNAIGGSRPLGVTLDSQIADDFVLSDARTITMVIADIMSHDGTLPAAEGVWVQIYENDSELDAPLEQVFAEVLIARDDIFADPIDTPLEFLAWRLHIDISHAGIRLEPGRWWLNVQPIDVNTTGDWFWWIGSVSVDTIGARSYVRDGGAAHGNGYGGLWGSSTWIPHDFRGNNTLSMRIEGVADCPADLNGDGEVDAADYFLYLDYFASGDPRADINGDGEIDGTDFFLYLDLFAQGCPD